MLDIDKELAICEAATPGPWTPMIESDRGYTDDEPSEFVRWFWPTFKEAPRTDFIGDQEEPAKQAERDGKFLSAARTGYPEALRRLKRLREIIGPMIAMPSKTVDVASGEAFDSTLLCNEVDLREILRLLALGKENAPA